jgi:heme exporter protein C
MLDLNIQGYNTHFDEAKNIRAWLKFEDHTLLASTIKSNSSNQLIASFDIPALLPSPDKVVAFTLITDNDKDGASVLPNAVFIKQTEANAQKALATWKNSPVENLNEYPGIAFPFRNVLGETIRNLYYHVALWFSMFILLAISVFYNIRYLSKSNLRDDQRANSLIMIGVVFGLLGCATGSIWAKHTWGTWWTTDVKLNMAAIFMLIYLAYFVLRGSFQDEIKRARLASVYSIFAFASIIPLLFVIPRLVDSLHPGNGGNPGFGGEDLDSTMRMAFYPAIIGMTLLGLWMADLRYRYEVIKEKMFDR